MSDGGWWGIAMLPIALGIGCVIVVGLWYRRRGAARFAIVVRIAVVALCGLLGYGLLALPWVTTREPFWRISRSAADWAIYGLLLYFGLAIGLGTGRDGWPLAAGYLVAIAAIFTTTDPEFAPFLAVSLGVLGLAFLLEDRVL